MKCLKISSLAFWKGSSVPDKNFKLGKLLGRLSNGLEKDRGRLVHLVDGNVALCKVKPGRRSAGWSFEYNGSDEFCEKCAHIELKLKRRQCDA